MIDQLLRNKGVRKTEFRKQVLEVFDGSNAAIDMESIESRLGKFDRITLYRTMKTFLEKGLIHEINLGGVKKFALCDHECGDDHVHHHEHVHFHCRSCQEIFCVEVAALPEISLPDYKIEQMEIQLNGVCNHCRE
jgi:Fur family ferric uptake transcriptional regulator